MSGRLLILCWHNVTPTWFFPGPRGAHLRGLAAQVKVLRRFCTPVDLESALDDLSVGRRLPPRAVALTFDDGYRDNLDEALPLLEELGAPATYFLVSGLLDGETAPWWELLGWAFARSAPRTVTWRGRSVRGGASPQRYPDFWRQAEELKTFDRGERETALEELVDVLAPAGPAPNWHRMFLDWDGAREMASRATVGSHTRWHGILSRESRTEQAAELAHAAERIRGELGVAARTLAYPNGGRDDYDDGSIQGAQSAGHDYAVTTESGLNSHPIAPFQVQRLVLDPLDGATVLRRVLRSPGLGGWLRRPRSSP
ncbi:MAG: polysaccharide deacetylase family protein [Thermoleophilia bacterium]|nr:polysaccharide deacetylase family protein [Thermoleophilia bacterium]